MSDPYFPDDPSDRLPSWDDNDFDHYDLEQWIKAAGSYVRTGDQLRPQVIEEVKQRAARRDAWKPMVQFASWGLSAALIWSLAVYAILLVVPRGLTASDLFNRAEERALTSGESPEWALSEVFRESRLSGTTQSVANQRVQRDGSVYREGLIDE